MSFKCLPPSRVIFDKFLLEWSFLLIQVYFGISSVSLLDARPDSEDLGIPPRTQPSIYNRSRGHKARGQGQKKIRGQGQPFRGPRTDTLEAKDRMLEAKAKDQGHKRKCSPKKKKKRSSQKFFKRSPQKNVFQKIFQALHKILTIQKILLPSSRGQANFRGLESSRPRTSKFVLEDVLEAKDVLEDSTSDYYVIMINLRVRTNSTKRKNSIALL